MNPRRRNTDAVNEALLAKRRAEVLRERRILIVMTGLCCLASILWLVALSTDYWIVVTLPGSKNASAEEEPAVLKSHLGIWRGCTTNRQTTHADPSAGRASDGCSFHNLDPEDSELAVSQPAIARTIVDYRRTVMALAALSLLCHVLAVSFSVYTFRNPRYTFKRLAGCLHFITAATMIVLIEVVSNGAEYAKTHLTFFFPAESSSHHGFSYYLAWLVFAQYGLAGLAFLLFSRKRKNLNITDESGMPLTDDEPQFMGR